MAEHFADHFSTQAAIYAQARPTYPTELFKWISSLAPTHQLAWDCGTGNGQSAFQLANYFQQIIATDPSADQLRNAFPKDNIQYHNAPAESVPSIQSNSVDVITVATALHWFDLPRFYAEANRVLKTNGVLVVWSYWGNRINTAIDELIDYFAYEFLLDYWPNGAKKNWIVQYKDVELPFTTIPTPTFVATQHWTLQQFVDYMMTWSSVNAYIKLHQSNPYLLIQDRLEKLWGDPLDSKECTWNLVVLASRK
jgi:ubiquinone/menaquinone biosynthesis C-methylase UbiE